MTKASTKAEPKSGGAKKSSAASAALKAPARERQTTVLGSQSTAAPRVVSAISLFDIRPDPNQPRKHFDLDDILPTIEVGEDGEALPNRGIREAIRIRRTMPRELHLSLDGVPRDGTPPMWTIIEGERRYRSAVAKGLRTIDCLPPEELGAQDLLLEQLGASVGKSPLLPLELADGVFLLAESGLDVEAIATRTGLGVRRVRRGLKLARLAAPVRKALEDKAITERVALAVATITGKEDQEKAVEKIVAAGAGDNVEHAERIIEDRFHLPLAPHEANFDPTAEIGPGPCNTCPKNTATQRALWSEFDETRPHCTDQACYDGKRAITWEKVSSEAKARGARVLDGKEAEKLFANEYSHTPTNPSIVNLDAQCPHGSGTEKWRDVLKHAARRLPSLVVRAHGKVREFITLGEAASGLRDAGLVDAANEETAKAKQLEAFEAKGDKKTAPRADKSAKKKNLDDEEEEATDERRAQDELLARVQKQASVTGRDKLLRFIALILVEQTFQDENIWNVSVGRFYPEREQYTKSAAACSEWIVKLASEDEVCAVVVELLLRRDYVLDDTQWEIAEKFVGVTRDELRALATATPADAPLAYPAPAPPARPECSVCHCTEAERCTTTDGGGCGFHKDDGGMCSLCAYVHQAVGQELDEKAARSVFQLAEAIEASEARVEIILKWLLGKGRAKKTKKGWLST